jgi:LacI family transcriptional regulator
MPNLTLEKIAEMAGVSRSTISRVVNNHPSVSGEVRQRVLKIIQETGYQPNSSARSLRSRRTNVTGLVLPQTIDTLFVDPYFPVLTQGIARACNLFRQTLALFLESQDKAGMKRIMQEGFLDGFGIQSVQMQTTIYEKLNATDIPFVIIGRPFIENATFVDVDNVEGAYQATRHLINQGYKRIGTITGDMNSHAGQDRLSGYRKALQEFGLPVDDQLIALGDFGEIMDYQGAVKLAHSQVDSIFIASDYMARSAIKAIEDCGLRVPQDIAIVGYDDLAPAVAAKPLLTTIRQPVSEMGFKAVEMLLAEINGELPKLRQNIMPIELVVRESSGIRR